MNASSLAGGYYTGGGPPIGYGGYAIIAGGDLFFKEFGIGD